MDQESGMYPTIAVILSLVFAIGVKFLTGFLVPKHITSMRRLWLWRHSLSELIFCGVVCVWCQMALREFWQAMDEDTTTNITLIFTRSSYYMVCFSSINMLVDIVDVAWNMEQENDRCIIAHHVLAIINGTVCLFRGQLLYIVTIGALMEFSGFLLHIRFLLNLYDVQRNSLGYRLFASVNMAAFVLMRVPVFIWVEWKLFVHRHDDGLDQNASTAVAISSLALMGVLINFMLKLINSDFSQKKEHIKK